MKKQKGGFVNSAILGAFPTVTYYLITNLGFAFYLANNISPLEAILIAQVNGAFFPVIYTVSNTFLFGIGVVPIVNTMRKLMARCKRREDLI